MVQNKPFGTVEGGFAAAMLALWPLARQALAPIDLKSRKGVIVAGHSKAAALSFLAASLLKSAHPTILVEDCCFAPPLTCDRTFRDNYDALGLRPFTVRYQNEDDLVPFLPWVPVLDAPAAAERLSRPDRRNRGRQRASAGAADRERLCADRRPALHHQELQHRARREGCARRVLGDRDRAGELQFVEIADAHSAKGRYLTCVCGG